MRADDAQRVTLAREYLAGVRQTGVEQLPPSRLMTEVAELRRQLGIVLGVIGHQAPALTGEQRGTVLAALADAARFADQQAAVDCAGCEAAPSGLCPEHERILDQGDAYRQVLAELGGQQ